MHHHPDVPRAASLPHYCRHLARATPVFNCVLTFSNRCLRPQKELRDATVGQAGGRVTQRRQEVCMRHDGNGAVGQAAQPLPHGSDAGCQSGGRFGGYVGRQCRGCGGGRCSGGVCGGRCGSCATAAASWVQPPGRRQRYQLWRCRSKRRHRGQHGALATHVAHRCAALPHQRLHKQRHAASAPTGTGIGWRRWCARTASGAGMKVVGGAKCKHRSLQRSCQRADHNRFDLVNPPVVASSEQCSGGGAALCCQRRVSHVVSHRHGVPNAHEALAAVRQGAATWCDGGAGAKEDGG